MKHHMNSADRLALATTEDPIPLGADPIWQPHEYVQGHNGWAATTHPALGLYTSWLVPISNQKSKSTDLTDWMHERIRNLRSQMFLT